MKTFCKEYTSTGEYNSAENNCQISIFDVLENYTLIELQQNDEITKYICIKKPVSNNNY
jgi:hypothetical protein